jgi:DNA-binding SARP family transcriptional activator/pimeloyl-ACP methyl ester carboxylesterase
VLGGGDTLARMAAAFGVLGPLFAQIDGVDVTPSAQKERGLLATLLVANQQVVTVDHLLEELWPDLDANHARHALQVRVGSLRKCFDRAGASALIRSGSGGYALDVDDDAIDHRRFSSLVSEARVRTSRHDVSGASASLTSALALWRGDALADVGSTLTLDAEAARLTDARVGAIEDRIDADLELGRHRELVPELDALVKHHPLRERLWGQRILALYRSDRQAEALRAAARLRKNLVEELGVDPGPTLRALEAGVLEQRDELRWSPPALPARDPEFAPPPIHYVRTPDGVNVAYELAGDGPFDLIIIPGYVSHLDTWWEAFSGRLVRRLAEFSRLILFDKRGTGLSDRPSGIDVEQWIQDTLAVMDTAGAKRAVVLGMSAGTPIAIQFAATYPERVSALVLYAGFARLLRAPDYPIGVGQERVNAFVDVSETTWGTGASLDAYCPSVGNDPAARALFGRYERKAASPGSASDYVRALNAIDVRHMLPLVSAPTLVLHPARDRLLPLAYAEYIVERIPRAKLVTLDSEDHLIWFSDAIEPMTAAIEEFLLADRTGGQPGRGGSGS